MNQELHLFWHALLFGMKMHIGYDGLRIMRRLWQHWDWMVSLEDILFWCIGGLCFFTGIYRENDGMIRFFIILGSMIGALLYHMFVSRFAMRWITWGIKWLKFKTKRVTLLLRNHLPGINIRKVAYGKSKEKKTKEKAQSAE